MCQVPRAACLVLVLRAWCWCCVPGAGAACLVLVLRAIIRAPVSVNAAHLLHLALVLGNATRSAGL
jgi:hypothetical protein